MIKGTTTTGFAFEIEDGVLDDYEFLEVLTDMGSGSMGQIPKALTMLLGEEQKNALKEHVRNESGRVSAVKMMAEMTEIFEAGGEIKNS